MSGLKFRPYTLTDKEACFDIFMSNTPRYFGVEEAVDFRKFLENPPCAYFVAMQNDEIVACGGYGYDNKKECIVLAWGMVHADLHKQGLGNFLLAERLKQIRIVYGDIMVQIDTSQRSKGFFEKHGFEAKNVTENYYAPGLHRVDMELRKNDNVSFAGS